MIARLIIEVEVDDDVLEDQHDLQLLLTEMEECAAKRSYSIYNQILEYE